MRMKESDDYITARAANPRTGLISPSVGTPPPRTPDNPDEALKLRLDAPSSPTHETYARPAFRRANEGRKVSAGSANQWRAGDKGWISKASMGLASPRETSATAGAEVAQPSLQDDHFVVHMPSAREPQPYAHPGRTPEQIAAFEHYLRKTRRVSGEGYGSLASQRMRQVSGKSLSTRVGSKTSAGQQYTTLKCDDPSSEDVLAHPAATSFAPYRSPRTPGPSKTHVEFETFPKTMPGRLDTITSDYSVVNRKPVRSTPKQACADLNTREDSPSQDTRYPRFGDRRTVSELSRLSPVRLVHPELASVPQSRPSRTSSGEARKCSLGCAQAMDGADCVEQQVGSSHARPPRRSLFEGADGDNHIGPQGTDYLAVVIDLTIAAVDSISRIGLPRLKLTPQQRAEAAKTGLMIGGQVLALLVSIALVWRLSDALVKFLGATLWSLSIPCMVIVALVRWLVL